MTRRMTFGQIASRVLLYAVVIVLSVGFAAPLVWMISTSLKTDPQVYTVPPIWIPNPMRFANYPEALSHRPFGTFAWNSIRYALLTALGAVLSSTLVAYGFSRIQWPGRDILFFVCISTMMIPFQVRMIPLYLIFKELKWLNTYKPLIVPTFLGGAYFIFLLRQFFMTIPQDLSDAARIDGCTDMGILVRIMLPLAKPVRPAAVYGFLEQLCRAADLPERGAPVPHRPRPAGLPQRVPGRVDVALLDGRQHDRRRSGDHSLLFRAAHLCGRHLDHRDQGLTLTTTLSLTSAGSIDP